MNNNQSFLIVTESIDVNDSSATKGRLALIQNLHSIGCHVNVLHYTRRQVELKSIHSKAIKEQKWHPWYILSKIQILIWRLFKININPFFEKRLGFSFGFFSDSFSFKKAIDKENPDDYDWVLTLSKAASFRPHHALLKCPQWHAKWLAYIHDPYPMHFYPRPYNWVAPGYYQQQEFMRAVSKACAYGVFPSKLLQEWMGSYFPDFLERGLIIPHQIIHNLPETPPTNYFDVHKFTILHAGSLMKPRDPKGLIKGFQLFLDELPEAKTTSSLWLVGKMDYHRDVIKEATKLCEQIIVEDQYINFNTVYNMQQLASVNVILEAKAEISPFLPGKVPHVVAAQKPILHLGPELSETRRVMGKDYIYWAEIDDVAKIASHLTDLYMNWKNGIRNYDFSSQIFYMDKGYLQTLFNELTTIDDIKNKK